MFRALIFAASFVTSTAVADEAPPVSVELYYESQCPSCQSFTTTTLKSVLDQPDMVDIIALKLVEYGNTVQNKDGSFSCQHGEGECETDAQELCVQYKLSGSLDSISTGDTSLEAWPFILCMEEAEGNPSMSQSCYEKTMNTSALPWSTISKCVEEEYDSVQTAAMNATPKHQYVPWVLVDGKLLENTYTLQKTICDAYTGVPPASCAHYLRASEPCYNTNV